jgi:uncharacterized protein YkwD
MRRVLVLAPLLLAACVVVVPPPDRSAPSGPATTVAAEGSLDASLAALRAANGLAPLRADPVLARVAAAHAADMEARGFFDHRSPDGTDPGSRARAGGCRWGAVAENIAWGQGTELAAFAGWQGSPEHLPNMLGRAYRIYGVGEAGGYWVMLLADRC